MPSILPPPTPFKVFVLAAGVSRVRVVDFVAAIAIGRGLRYFGWGLLAVYYGDETAEFLKTNAPTVALIVGVTVLLGGVAWILWRRRSERSTV